MSRIWNFGGSDKNGAGGPTSTALAPRDTRPVAPDGYWGPDEVPEEEEEEELYEQYTIRPVKPAVQIAARVGLWFAVAMGCIGGIVGLARPAPKAATQDVIDAALAAVENDNGLGVPAPVAGTAERAVQAWLEASEDDTDALDALFVQRPVVDEVNTDAITVLDTRPVAGGRLIHEGYWTVTVAVDLFEQPINRDPLPQTTWFVEVGIVGDVAKGLKALTTPAIVPAPSSTKASEWRPSAARPEAPQSDDNVAQKVEGFLRTLLTGNGDLSLYLLPDIEMRVADPAPFVQVELIGLSYTEITEEGPDQGGILIWALVRGTTAGESERVMGYEIKAFRPIDRWQIKSVWGAPEVEPVEPSDDAEAPATPPVTGSTTTALDDGLDTSSEDPPETTSTTGLYEGGEGDGTGTETDDPADGDFPGD